MADGDGEVPMGEEEVGLMRLEVPAIPGTGAKPLVRFWLYDDSGGHLAKLGDLACAIRVLSPEHQRAVLKAAGLTDRATVWSKEDLLCKAHLRNSELEKKLAAAESDKRTCEDKLRVLRADLRWAINNVDRALSALGGV